LEKNHEKTSNPKMREKGSSRTLKTRSLLFLATVSVALLCAGCSRSSPAGAYTYSRAGGRSTENLGGVDAGVTFILELRSNGSYVSTVESVIRGGYKRAEGDLPTGRGTWQVQDGTVLLSSGGREVARFLVEGLDLIDVNGARYMRIRWLARQEGDRRVRPIQSVASVAGVRGAPPPPGDS
jgi:hypothetical protein